MPDVTIPVGSLWRDKDDGSCVVRVTRTEPDAVFYRYMKHSTMLSQPRDRQWTQEHRYWATDAKKQWLQIMRPLRSYRANPMGAPC